MGKKITHILIVEDSRTQVELIRRSLEPLAGLSRLTVAGSLAEARLALAKSTPDLAIIDLYLPDGRGTELLPAGPGEASFPAVIMTSQGDEEAAVEVMKGGALDYLVKSTAILADMPHIVERTLREWGHIIARQQAEKKARQLAYYDPLTGLPNRLLLQEDLQGALARTGSGKILALLFLDLDRFKTINDTLGHAVGDLLLQATARRLRASLGQQGLIARLGGDEFVVLLPDLESRELAEELAGRILQAMTAPFDLDGKEVYSSTSIGIALYPQDAEQADTLLKYADMAMYEAKKEGRNTFRFFTKELNRQAMERLRLETHLRRAIRLGEFFLVYQPQIDVHTGRVVGMEALLRWRHPRKGLISPGQLLPVAEETGLIHPLWEWSLRTACRQNRAWLKDGYPPRRVAINLPGHKFKEPGLVDLVDRILAKTGLKPSCLELELTEGVLMEDAEATLETLSRLKEREIGLAIDDFGIGFTSLIYLKDFPVDRIKIARQLVRGVATESADAAIVDAIIAMARSLNFKVTAVGVENREQMEALRSRGCHEMQGFYFARPMLPETISRQFPAAGEENGLCPFSGTKRKKKEDWSCSA